MKRKLIDTMPLDVPITQIQLHRERFVVHVSLAFYYSIITVFKKVSKRIMGDLVIKRAR